MRVCPRCSEIYPENVQRCLRCDVQLRGVPDPLVGTTISGRYRLLSRIGSGGMSSVYLARHVMIDRIMAIKTLRRDLATDPVQRDRFLREARAVNRINHENIVEITDFGESDDGLVYLVMEYVPGEPLLRALKSAPFPVNRALHIAEQTGSALARAHHMGVVHRDLKPENLLLVQKEGRPDFVKILDFGIAKILDAPALTGSQQIFGTPGYIAPEYIQSTRIDGRADLYSLGVILYEMVTKALPFEYEYPGDLLVKHVTEQPVPPRTREPSVHPAVEELILRCLQKEPDDRFRDAFHFLEELRATRERVATEAFDRPMHPRVTLMPRQIDRRTRPVDVGSEHEASVRLPHKVEPGASRDHSQATLLATTADKPEGLLGAGRWRHRFDVLQAAFDECEIRAPAPPHVAQAMAFASVTLEKLEDGVRRAEKLEEEIQALRERAREFRASLGAEIDRIASRLSHIERASSGPPASRAPVSKVQQRDRAKLETDLIHLRKELEAKNEEVEVQLGELVRTFRGEIDKLAPVADSLREPLALVETFVHQRWDDGMPAGRVRDETSRMEPLDVRRDDQGRVVEEESGILPSTPPAERTG